MSGLSSVTKPAANPSAHPAGSGAAAPTNLSRHHSTMDFPLLERHGIPAVPHHVAQTSAQAVHAAKALGFPVALKLMSPKVLHKSEHHALSLNLQDEKSVEREFSRLSHLVPTSSFEGILVQRYLPSRLEIIIGGRTDAQFGPVLLLGMGGIYTELLNDVALRVCPVDEALALQMIRSLKAYPLLAGARNQAGIDLHELARILVRTSELMMQSKPQELDINPLLATQHGLLAADVRVIR